MFKANRPSDLLVFPCLPTFIQFSKRSTFYIQVLWASEFYFSLAEHRVVDWFQSFTSAICFTKRTHEWVCFEGDSSKSLCFFGGGFLRKSGRRKNFSALWAKEAYSKAVLLGGGSGPLLQLGELHLESARRGRRVARGGGLFPRFVLGGPKAPDCFGLSTWAVFEDP